MTFSHPRNSGGHAEFKRLALPIAALLALLLVMPSTGAHAGGLFDYFSKPKTLDTVVEGISARYEDIEHISTKALADKLESGADIILVDVRESGEFNVSRLPGAIHTSPAADAAQLDKTLAQSLKDQGVKGKTVVFYCSVGERSSIMARRTRANLMSQGATEVYNLSGGVFAWHNESRQLESDEGTTPYVHPYDKSWGRLVDRKSLTRMTKP